MIKRLPTEETQERIANALEFLGQVFDGTVLPEREEFVEYGIREIVGQEAPEYERVLKYGNTIKYGNDTGLIAGVAVDDEDVFNSFDYIPIFNREKVVVNWQHYVKAKKSYVKLEFNKVENGIAYNYKWVCAKKLDGYVNFETFIDDRTGREKDFQYLARYEGSVNEQDQLVSVPNAYPVRSINIDDGRTKSRKNDGNGSNTDSDYGVHDIWEVGYLQTMFEIEFATKNSQDIFIGATNMAYSSSDITVDSRQETNDINLGASASNFVIGQTVILANTHDSNNGAIFLNRQIVDINGDIITVDGDPFDYTQGLVLSSRAWKTGTTDHIKVSGVRTAKSDKYPFVWRGIENFYGNAYKGIDGIKILNQVAYVCKNREHYNHNSDTTNYTALSYVNAQSDNYVKELGYDSNFPTVRLPITTGGGASSSKHYCDYYYQNTGYRSAWFGGRWYYGVIAGSWFWHLAYTLTNTNITRLIRPSFNPPLGG